MNKTLKRTLAIALTLVMLTAMVPMMASGANVPETDFNRNNVFGITKAPVTGELVGSAQFPSINPTLDPSTWANNFTVEHNGWTAGVVTINGQRYFGNAGSAATYRMTLSRTGTTNIFIESVAGLVQTNITNALGNVVASGGVAGNVPPATVLPTPLTTPVRVTFSSTVIIVDIDYVISSKIVDAFKVTSDIDGTPITGQVNSTVKTPVIADQDDIKDFSARWMVGSFGTSSAPLEVRINAADNYTFAGASFLKDDNSDWKDNAARDSIRGLFPKATGITFIAAGQTLVFQLSYPVEVTSPTTPTGLLGLLENIQDGIRIPISSSITINNSTANAPGSVNNQINIGGDKTLVLSNGAVVTLSRNVLQASAGRTLTVEGNGTLVIPGSAGSDFISIVVNKDATFSTSGTGDNSFTRPIRLNNGSTLAANGAEFKGAITVWQSATATLTGNLTLGAGGTITVQPGAKDTAPGKLNASGTITISNNGSSGITINGELHAGTITRNGVGVIITGNPAADVPSGLIKASTLNLNGWGTITNNGAIVANTLNVDLSSVAVGLTPALVSVAPPASGQITTRGLLLAVSVNGSGAGGFTALDFVGNNAAVDARQVKMLEVGETPVFNLRKIGDGAAFFNVTDNNKITGWYTDRAGATTNRMNNISFQANFGPLYAQWEITTPTIPAPKTPEELVKGFFEYMLGRGSDADGLKYWTEEITSGRLPGRQLGVAFVTSPEFTSRQLSNADFVEALYKGILGRISEEQGKAYWVGMLATQSRAAVARDFANAGEFKALLESLKIAW